MSAAGSLGLKMHTRQQLREKLLSKEYAADVTERALDRMEELVSTSCVVNFCLWRHCGASPYRRKWRSALEGMKSC